MKHRKPDLWFDLWTIAVEMANMLLYLADMKATVFKFLVIFKLPVALLPGFLFYSIKQVPCRIFEEEESTFSLRVCIIIIIINLHTTLNIQGTNKKEI